MNFHVYQPVSNDQFIDNLVSLICPSLDPALYFEATPIIIPQYHQYSVNTWIFNFLLMSSHPFNSFYGSGSKWNPHIATNWNVSLSVYISIERKRERSSRSSISPFLASKFYTFICLRSWVVCPTEFSTAWALIIASSWCNLTYFFVPVFLGNW